MAKVNIVMDVSQFDLFCVCAERYNNRYNKNKTLPGKDMRLDRGSTVHAGNEVYYEALRLGSNYQDAVTAALSRIREYAVVSTSLDNDVINQIVEVMEEYYDYWQVADQSFKIVDVERPFIYLLYEDDEVRMHMAGKIDLVTTDNKYTNKPTDHKTYDRRSEIYRMNNQFENYAIATNSNFLDVNRIGFQKSLKPHEKFIRVPLCYDPIYLEAWKKNTVKIMFQYLTCAAEDSWPMNLTSCDKYNRTCEYHQVCDSSGEPAKLYKLAANYIDVEPWDVSKVLRKASQILEDDKKKVAENVTEQEPRS